MDRDKQVAITESRKRSRSKTKKGKKVIRNYREEHLIEDKVDDHKDDDIRIERRFRRQEHIENVRIIYEKEDAHQTDVFKKYVIIQRDNSRTGSTIRNYIEMSDYYMKNFKATRDSDFTEYEDYDLNPLKYARQQEIEMIREGERGRSGYRRGASGRRGESSQERIDIYQVKKRSKQGTMFKLDKYQRVDDLQVNQTEDEEKLIEHFLLKRDNKAKQAEGIREKQTKMMELNQMIRRFDINNVRKEELEALNIQMLDVNQKWAGLKERMESKLKVVERIHKKHQEEVKDYQDQLDNLDKTRFKKKIQKATFEMYTDQKDQKKSKKDMEAEKEKVRIYLVRAKKDLDDELLKNDQLQKQLSQIEGSTTEQNNKLRIQIEKMKKEMDRINSYSIDIAKDPAKAIQRISDPIMNVLNAKVEDYETTLKENLTLRKYNIQIIIENKNQIFEQRVRQINLRRRKEEIQVEFYDLREDIEIVQVQMLENIKRKFLLSDKLEASTQKFKEEASDLRQELEKMRNKLIGLNKHKEMVEDQADFLLDDRGPSGKDQKYYKSITEFVTMAKSLKERYKIIQTRILDLNVELKIDPLYMKLQQGTRKKKAEMVTVAIQEFYKLGKHEEREKKETMMKDLEKKQVIIQDLLSQKESLEESLAAFGNIHHIHKTFREVQDDIKLSIRKFLREKHTIHQHLAQLLQLFEQNSEAIGLQEGALKTHIALFKAVNYLMQEKELNIKILEDELVEVQKHQQDLNHSFSSQDSEKVIAYERELVITMEQDKKKKDQEISSLKAILVKKDQELDSYFKLLDEQGSQLSQEEVLVEEKARAILAKHQYYSAMKRISKNTFKIGDVCLVYLKLDEHKPGFVERELLVRPSIKGERLKNLKQRRMDGQYYYNFEEFVKKVVMAKGMDRNNLNQKKRFLNSLDKEIIKGYYRHKNASFTSVQNVSSSKDRNHPSSQGNNNTIMNIFQKLKKKKKQEKPQQKIIDGSLLVKRANYYFDKNPTYLKESEIGEHVAMNLKRYVEDISTQRIPQFGYPLLTFEEQSKTQDKPLFKRYIIGEGNSSVKKKKAIEGGTSRNVQFSIEDKTQSTELEVEEDLPFQEALRKKRQQERIMDHVMMCFTYGKKVRRHIDDEPSLVSRVELLKKKFKRLDLLRDYFSVKKASNFRKFKFPLNESAFELNNKALDIYDELQYCQESDIEELRRPSPRKIEKQKAKLFKNQQHKSLTNLVDESSESNASQNENPQQSDTDSLNVSLEDSICSSPRYLKNQENLAFDKVMPFDFITQRKVRQFYCQDQINLELIMKDKFRALELTKKLNDYDEDLDEREVPEINDKFKKIHKIVPRKNKKRNKDQNKKLVIKGELSSSSDDERFNKYNFAQKVQNTQIRDQSNELQSLFFQRSQAKNNKVKRETLAKIAEFKWKITKEQRDVLQNRQFVIVDSKSLHQSKLNNFFTKRKEYVDQEERDKKEAQEKEEYYLDRQRRLQTLAKGIILREKSKFSSRNSSIAQASTSQNRNLRQSQNSSVKALDESIYTYSEGRNKSRKIFMSGGFTSTISSVTQLMKGRGQEKQQEDDPKNIYSNNNFDNIRTQRISSSNKFASNLKETLMRQTQSKINMEQQNSMGNEYNSNHLASYQESAFNAKEELRPTHFSQDYTVKEISHALHNSPYTQIMSKVQNSYSTQRIGNQSQKTKIRGYLAEKLRRKSVLNCELFRGYDQNQKNRVASMLAKINQVVGTQITKNQRD